jgi:N12 class adenine-specific DNA methylase
VRANVAALATLRSVQRESRPAAAGEQQTMARWSGWGAVPEVFDESRQEFAWAREQLADLLTPQELAAAARSTLNAHYTDAALVQAMWAAARQLGFDGGQVLEPGSGSGNFIGFAPAGAHVTGVEMEPVTAAIAAILYPTATIVLRSFAGFRAPEAAFDLVIGNVPFGQVTLHDPRHNRSGHSIHNHFIIKSLHLTRPSGLVMVLTSRYTMDARNPAARREIAGLADLAGALRLPGGAHQRAAGTGVVTDLLVLRRREPGRDPDATAWEQTRMIELDGARVPVSEYFLDHPEAVLGTIGAVSGAYRADDLVVTPAGDTIEAFARGLDRITADAGTRDLTWTPAPTAALPPPAPTLASQHPDGYLEAGPDGAFTEVADGVARPFEVPRSQAAELRALLTLRDTAVRLLEAEAAAAEDTPDTERLRGELGRLYDAYVRAYGPLNRFSLRRTGRTDPATGEPVMARVAPPQGGFRGDPFAPLVYALEDFDPAGQRAAKATIFTHRVVAPRTPRLGADTAADALAICLDTRGEAHLGEIARLLGVSEDQARAELGTQVFDDPQSGPLVPAAEYLSGNVRGKLRAAERAARDDPRFEVNAAELRQVIPPDLSPGEIDARLGAAWIDAGYVEQFLRETLDDPKLRVEHPGGQIWAVRGNAGSVLAASTWGTERYPAPQLAQAILEQRKIEVRDLIQTPDGDRSVPNVDATLAAQEKAAELGEHFAQWAWQDPARAGDLARTYNERFNNLVLRSYDNTQLTLPGLSLAFRPRQHQVAAVARMIHEPAVLLAHEVGAGKTAEMIMGITELRRLGLARKPVIVVPNHMLEQFARDWLQLYPQSRVLVARREHLRRDRRREFVARCATGDWDGIVMSRSAFERIPLSAAEQAAYTERELDQLRRWIATAKNGEGLTVKRLEASLLRAEERLKARLDSAKDPGITFEATGVDYLCIDEAHGYKNLQTVSNITDAAIDGSMRASDLDMKIDYLRRRNGARVVTFATATPIANSVTEAHVMQRYLRPDLLEAAGISVFDSWAATFAEVVTQVELAPEGGDSFRVKSRFARFRNVPEMLRMWHMFADVKTAADLNLPVPALAQRPGDGRRVPETVTVEPSEDLIDYVAGLGRRAEAIRNRAVGPEEDNMLKVSGDGRRAALDLRLAGLPQTIPGKLAAAADRITAIWRAHRDDEYRAPDGAPYPVRGSLQLVFCDLGTPGPGWNAYHELRDQLTARGLPRDAVRFVHEAKNDTDLARLFAACRSGHVAVLIGSTEKMGVGTNVQDRAIALHHLDAPWRPADVAQREGRIIRQGNLNAEVQVIRHLTARSFDGYMWQTLERKARFIHDIMSPTLDTREIGDIGDTVLSFAEAKALATDNPLLMDKAEADATLSRLVRAERAHLRNQDALRRAIDRLEKHIAAQTRLAEDIDAAIARQRDTRGEAFTMTVDGHSYRKRADAGQHLLSILRQEAGNQLGFRQRTLRTGELGGFPLTVTVSQSLGQVRVTPALDGAPGAEMTLTAADLSETDPAGLVTRLENRLGRLEANKARALAEIGNARGEIEHATASIGKPFPQAADLAAARERSRQIDEQLEAAATPPQQQDAAPEDPPEAGPTARVHNERHASPGNSAEDAREPNTPARRAASPPAIAQRSRPPWPSAAERTAGPTPSRDRSPGADWGSAGLRQRGSALPQYREGGPSHDYPRSLDRPVEEREAGQ